MTDDGRTPPAILAQLSRWNRRWRSAQSLRWGPRGLTVGLVLALLIAVAARIWPLAAPGRILLLAAVWAWREYNEEKTSIEGADISEKG